MSLILGYDSETTGLSVKSEYIIEVGAAIYDTDKKQIMKTYSNFILWPSRPIIPKEAYDTHGIDQDMIEKWGSPPEEVFSEIFRLADNCDYLVSHNGLGYDRPITEHNILRINDPSKTLVKKFYGYKWIDTLIDLPFTKKFKTKELEYLAHKHDYHMKGAHRALNDVQAMLYILSCYDFELVRNIASTPYQTIEAKVSYEDREKAKQAGFYWNSDNKKWEKKQRKYFTDKDASQLSFGIGVCDPK